MPAREFRRYRHFRNSVNTDLIRHQIGHTNATTLEANKKDAKYFFCFLKINLGHFEIPVLYHAKTVQKMRDPAAWGIGRPKIIT